LTSNTLISQSIVNPGASQDAGTSTGYEYAPEHLLLHFKAAWLDIFFFDANMYLVDTQAGDRQTGRKAQLSNITAAKT
jgi:hypothetical protein